MAVWVIRAGRGGLHADAFEEHAIVALSVEHVPSIAGLSHEKITEHAIARKDVNAARARGHAAMLYRFANELHVGDFVLTPNAEDASVLVGRIVGEYEYRDDPPIPGDQHVRRVEWFGRLSRAELGNQVRRAIGAPMAVYKPGAQEAVAQVVSHLVN